MADLEGTDWTPRGDRMLALLPVEHPIAFDQLSFDEQKWRGRVFLITYTHTGSMAYSWWVALREEAGDAEAKALVGQIDDEEIAFRVAEAAQGRWYGPPETELPGGAPPA